MRKEENDCIRYLMKEMDPSEELLMERAMMEDENLLIEVESMRQTLQKLNKLPELDPPSQVTNNILAKASEHAVEERYSFIYKPVYKYAAAVLALIITAGGAWVYFGTGKSGEKEVTVSAIISQSPQVQPQNTTNLQFKGTGMQAVSSVPPGNKDVEPWVDRNNILRFQDQFLSNSRNFEAILKNSTKKLQLIDTPVNAGQRVKSIQLTGN